MWVPSWLGSGPPWRYLCLLSVLPQATPAGPRGPSWKPEVSAPPTGSPNLQVSSKQSLPKGKERQALSCFWKGRRCLHPVT